MDRKKIVFMTGTRADFGKLKPLIKKIESSEHYECYIFVTGMHTLSKYGATHIEVRDQGFNDVYVYMNQTNTTAMDIVLANTIVGFSNFVNEIKPDMIVVHGDRVEALAGAIVGALNNILVSHIEGGEVSGTIDELIRHATSKLSHLHFVANGEAMSRLAQMGENEDSIHVIGSPDIDIMCSKDLPNVDEIKKHYGIEYDDYGIFIYHPVTTELDMLACRIHNVVSALIESKMNYIVIYPNNDPGSDVILREYKRFDDNVHFKVFPSIRFERFLSLFKCAKFIVGNSSMGPRVSEIYGIPSVNIGSRQNNRSASQNIINVSENKCDILEAIVRTQDLNVETTNNFGDGKSSERFFNVLAENHIWQTNVQKSFFDRACGHVGDFNRECKFQHAECHDVDKVL